MRRMLSLALAAAMLTGLLAGCKLGGNNNADGYTYNSYTSALATNWNPHTWEMNADNAVVSYLTTPLADMTVKDSAKVADIAAWKAEGALGLVKKDGGIQAVYGPKADVLKSDINDIL